MELHKRPLNFVKDIYKLPMSIKLISFIIGVYSVGWGIALPYMAIYFNEMLNSYAATGFIMGITAFLGLIWVLPLGVFIDKVPKKLWITITLGFYIPLSFILLSLSNFSHFIFYRIYHSFIRTSLWDTTDAYLRIHSPKKHTSEAMGLYDTLHAVGFMVGPLIGAYFIINLGYNIFYGITLFSTIAFLLSFLLPQHNKQRLKDGLKIFYHKSAFGGHFKSFKNRKIVWLAVTSFFFYFCVWSVVVFLLPLYFQKLEVGLVMIGVLFALFHFPRLFEIYFSSIADNRGKSLILTKGLLFGAIFFLLMFFVTDIIVLYILTVLLSFSFAAIIPALQGRITDLLPRIHIAKGDADIRFFRFIGAGLGPIVAGVLSHYFGLKIIFLLCFIIFAGLALVIGKRID
ncbi:MFS transporter [Nanoarchaeota archaeon]